jgi:hypothetical protein
MMEQKQHYVLNIQNGRHIAAQKLVLPKPPAAPTPAPAAPQADDQAADE